LFNVILAIINSFQDKNKSETIPDSPFLILPATPTLALQHLNLKSHINTAISQTKPHLLNSQPLFQISNKLLN